jgi:hypothetical protein
MCPAVIGRQLNCCFGSTCSTNHKLVYRSIDRPIIIIFIPFVIGCIIHAFHAGGWRSRWYRELIMSAPPTHNKRHLSHRERGKETLPRAWGGTRLSPRPLCESHRDASACIRRQQGFALAPVRESERCFRVYADAPGFLPPPVHKCVTQSRVARHDRKSIWDIDMESRYGRSDIIE